MLVARFREKGATSPEKAMTAQELGLPPRFEDAMKRRLGATGIFVETGGKALPGRGTPATGRAARRRNRSGRVATSGGQWVSRRNMYKFRMVRMVVGVAAVALCC